ncbi:MAG: TolC family protein [Nitrospira sp.]|nr:TolC family protein [Nitrospira sp.]MDE0486785.1 TolC family protein [Nitrospira sp.]
MRSPRAILTALLLGSLATTGQAAEPPHVKKTVMALPASSPALVEFVRKVVPSNPRVKAARSALNASGAFHLAASQPLYNPGLSFESQHAHEHRHYLGLEQRIDLVDKRSARTAVASADRLAIHADYIFTRRAVTADLLSGLAGYQTGVERDALATKRVRLMQEFAALTKRRFEAGDMARVEFNLAVLVFADARMKQATVRTTLIDARQQVTNLVPPDSRTPWPTLEAGLPALPAQDDLESLLMELPEVQAAQRRVDSAKAVISLRNRQRVLDPTIGFSRGEEAGEPLFGLNLVLPLPLRNPFKYEVTAAYERYRQAQQTVNDVLRRARARLVNAFERYRIAQSTWQDWQRIGPSSAQQQADHLRRLWQAGELSATEFLVQTSRTIDSQDSALQLRQALWLAWFEWLIASGKVDEWLKVGSYTKTTGTSG